MRAKTNIIGGERLKELRHWDVVVSFMSIMKLLRTKTSIVLEKTPMNQEITSSVNDRNGPEGPWEITECGTVSNFAWGHENENWQCLGKRTGEWSGNSNKESKRRAISPPALAFKKTKKKQNKTEKPSQPANQTKNKQQQ